MQCYIISGVDHVTYIYSVYAYKRTEHVPQLSLHPRRDMKITHEIWKINLDQQFNLEILHNQLQNCHIQRRHFKVLIWKQFHKGTCQIFPSGKAILHGSKTVAKMYIDHLKQFYSELNASEHSLQLVTRSACHRLTKQHIDFHVLKTFFPDLNYHPELFCSGALLHRSKMSFRIFYNGHVIICGITNDSDKMDLVFETILDLESALL